MQNLIISTVLMAEDREPKALIRLGLTTFLRYVSNDLGSPVFCLSMCRMYAF